MYYDISIKLQTYISYYLYFISIIMKKNYFIYFFNYNLSFFFSFIYNFFIFTHLTSESYKLS